MRLTASIVALLLSPLAGADTPPPLDCSGEGFHRLDFWIGDWKVETPDGKPAGLNRIEPDLNGCLLLEHWTGFSDTGEVDQRGLGVHRYDRRTDHWLQAWTFDVGVTYDLVGHLEGARMIYDHVTNDPAVKRRSTLEPLPDGRVEQKGERWDEASKSWQTTFDYIYRRASSQE